MAVQIKRTHHEQRRHPRVTAPLYVDVDGQRARASDWSLGGLRVDQFPGQIPGADAPIALGLTLPYKGLEISFDAKAKVVRRDPANAMFTVQFTDLGEREIELMQHFLDELARGAVSAVEPKPEVADAAAPPAFPMRIAKALTNVLSRRWG